MKYRARYVREKEWEVVCPHVVGGKKAKVMRNWFPRTSVQDRGVRKESACRVH